MAATTPLRNKPRFTSAARLEIPFSVLIEILHPPDLPKRSDTADPGTLAFDSRARPPRQKCPAATWVDLRRRCASPARPTLGGRQSQSCEVADHLSEQGRSRPRLN